MLFYVLCISLLVSVACTGSPCTDGFPKTYVTHKLASDEKIVIDGKLDDDGWEHVEWTNYFIDIINDTLPTPRFKTRAKMRWDDSFLYVGAHLEENQIWSYIAWDNGAQDRAIFADNDFEVFVDSDGSFHWYKEFEMNGLNHTMNLGMDKPYIDGGNYNMNGPEAHKGLKCAPYFSGMVLNKPDPARDVKNSFWSVEVRLPLHYLVTNKTQPANYIPAEGDLFRMSFSRVQYYVWVNSTSGLYQKVPGLPEDNWVWTPQQAINMHLPWHWGFLQFTHEPKMKEVPFDVESAKWPLRVILLALYEAQVAYNSANGRYAMSLTELPKEMQDLFATCAADSVLDITPTRGRAVGYLAQVKDKATLRVQGSINDDRYMYVPQFKVQ